jgi:hypothetical protein
VKTGSEGEWFGYSINLPGNIAGNLEWTPRSQVGVVVPPVLALLFRSITRRHFFAGDSPACALTRAVSKEDEKFWLPLLFGMTVNESRTVLQS